MGEPSQWLDETGSQDALRTDEDHRDRGSLRGDGIVAVEPVESVLRIRNGSPIPPGDI